MKGTSSISNLGGKHYQGEQKMKKGRKNENSKSKQNTQNGRLTPDVYTPEEEQEMIDFLIDADWIPKALRVDVWRRMKSDNILTLHHHPLSLLLHFGRTLLPRYKHFTKSLRARDQFHDLLQRYAEGTILSDALSEESECLDTDDSSSDSCSSTADIPVNPLESRNRSLPVKESSPEQAKNKLIVSALESSKRLVIPLENMKCLLGLRRDDSRSAKDRPSRGIPEKSPEETNSKRMQTFTPDKTSSGKPPVAPGPSAQAQSKSTCRELSTTSPTRKRMSTEEIIPEGLPKRRMLRTRDREKGSSTGKLPELDTKIKEKGLEVFRGRNLRQRKKEPGTYRPGGYGMYGDASASAGEESADEVRLVEADPPESCEEDKEASRSSTEIMFPGDTPEYLEETDLREESPEFLDKTPEGPEESPEFPAETSEFPETSTKSPAKPEKRKFLDMDSDSDSTEETNQSFHRTQMIRPEAQEFPREDSEQMNEPNDDGDLQADRQWLKAVPKYREFTKEQEAVLIQSLISFDLIPQAFSGRTWSKLLSSDIRGFPGKRSRDLRNHFIRDLSRNYGEFTEDPVAIWKFERAVCSYQQTQRQRRDRRTERRRINQRRKRDRHYSDCD